MAYLNRETEYGWDLCLDGGRIICGMGILHSILYEMAWKLVNVQKQTSRAFEMGRYNEVSTGLSQFL